MSAQWQNFNAIIARNSKKSYFCRKFPNYETTIYFSDSYTYNSDRNGAR